MLPGDIVQSTQNNFGVKYVITKVRKYINKQTYTIQVIPECGDDRGYSQWVMDEYTDVEESDIRKVGTYRKEV